MVSPSLRVDILENGRTPSPHPTHLSVPGHPDSSRYIDAGPGYKAAPFEGKEKQLDSVIRDLEAKGFIPNALIENETLWFYNNLGIDDSYFSTESVGAIVNHIIALYGAKVAAYARDDKQLEIRLDREAEDHAVYIDTSQPGVSRLSGPQYEHRIDERYLNLSTPARAYRLETFRSQGQITGSKQQLRCYFLYKCVFGSAPNENETDIDKISDKLFLQKITPNTKTIYQSIVSNAVGRTGPVIEVFEIEGTRERRLVIGYRQRSALNFFSALSDLYHYYGLTSTRKYVEQFSNGITVMSLYLQPNGQNPHKFPPIEASIYQILKETSLLYCIPRNFFQTDFASGRMSLQETIYAHCGSVFVSNFLNRLGSEYTTLASLLDTNNPVHNEILLSIKRRFRQETFTREYIIDIIAAQPMLVRMLYLAFANTHYIQTRGEHDGFLPTLSYQRLQTDHILGDRELQDLIRSTCANDHEIMVMEAFRIFNGHVLKTNFFTLTKVALSFRLDPSFLPEMEYPQKLFGMFLIIGSEFRGFHLRFRDIARGGIRIVKSRNREAYSINARSIFDENYNLASTQQRKNKDIPEGGSKGVILLDHDQQDKPSVSFQKYIDSILDLLLPGESPGIKDKIVDLYGKEEILFMGPDENTAGLVDWATQHARERHAPWWKSFFTGKSPSLGGIPHDTYGMTSLSVRQYVLGIYRKLGLDETEVSKMQTGGPDGDLGSNEILLSKENYTCIVDGSGVLIDPNGLDRQELVKLAKGRKMISFFDVSKLSSKGCRVLVDESNVKLPSGEMVANGTKFRNTFHLRGQADLFVPCGGRPEAINTSNVSQLIHEGKSKYSYIVEGANLFLTQDAKKCLEAAGAIIFKDASANKGGVTSSSLEVLASLAFDNDGFINNMCVVNGKAPEFYMAYVESVQRIIENNATLEFEAIWREHKETGKPRTIISDELSYAIAKLKEELVDSDLWDNSSLRRAVLRDALPKLLLDKIGLETILKKVPESYTRAIFGSFLASRFVYEKGINPGQFAFFAFMQKQLSTIQA